MSQQLDLFGVATTPIVVAKPAPAAKVPLAPVTISLQARVQREGGGPACQRVRVDQPHLLAPAGYPIKHLYQLHGGLPVLVAFPHKLPHWPEGEPVLTRFTSFVAGFEGDRVSFGVGGYGYYLHELPTPPLAYPRGDAAGPYSKALLVAGDLVSVQPDKGKPYVGTLLDTLWLNPARNQIMLRVCVMLNLSEWVIKKASIGSIYPADSDWEKRLAEQHVLAQSWYYNLLSEEVAA